MTEQTESPAPRKWCLKLVILFGVCPLVLLTVAGGILGIAVLPRLKIARDTTFVSGPVLADGKVDFEAAFNQRYAAGIKPDENAVVILDRAITPEFDSLESRDRYYKYLGVTEPLRDKCLISEEQFAVKKWGAPNLTGEIRTEFLNACSQAQSNPWTRTQFPDTAAWVDENQSPLKLIEEASRRPRYHDPIAISDSMAQAKYGLLQHLRIAARLFATRAMLRSSSGESEAAMRDLLTCHRLARLVGQHPTSIANGYAFAIDASCSSAEQELISAGLTSEQALSFLAELQSLSRLPDISSTVNVGERIMALEQLQVLWFGTNHLSVRKPQFNGLSVLDINVALRKTNQFFDRQVQILQTTNRADREAFIAQLEAELKATEARRKSIPELLSRIAWEGRHAITAEIADINISLIATNYDGLLNSRNRAETRLNFLKLSLALTCFHHDNHQYPETIQELAPKFIDQIPLDIFTDQTLSYKRLPDATIQEEGFVLYSVGANGHDEGGIVRDDVRSDGVVFRVMHSKQQKQ